MQKTILVTGGAGFIGTNLCARLVEEGNKVISLDNYFTGSEDNHISGVEYRRGHTKDIEKHISESVDLVFHLGEYSRTEQSLHEPELVWDLNIQGTLGVLEFCRKRNLRLVYAGSSTKFSESGAGKDQSPYAFSKATNAALVRNYGEWFGLSYAIAYFYNVYGPHERSGKYGTLIEIFKQQFREKLPLTVVSPGTQKRIFTHVNDIVDGLLLIGEKGEGDGFGLGADQAYSVLEVAKMFHTPLDMIPERKGNRLDAVIDTSKTRALGWAPRERITDYIASIIGSTF